jgi:prevent-host-death family protein
MLNLSTTEARRRFSEIVTGAAHKGQRVMLTHYGKPVAAVIPIDDLRRLEAAARAQLEDGKAPARRTARL